MLFLDRWLGYLEANRIRYSHSVHRRAETALETAAAERIHPHDLAKTIVYNGDNGFGIAVVPGDELVDLPEVARLLGSTHMRLADEGELAEIFPDCELGAMPPFGEPFRMPVLLDSGLAGREFIAFVIGTHRDVVRISVADYLRLVRPLVGGLTLRHTLMSDCIPAGKPIIPDKTSPVPDR